MYSISPTKFETPCILTLRDNGFWYVLDGGFIIIPNNYVTNEIEETLNKVFKNKGLPTIINRE